MALNKKLENSGRVISLGLVPTAVKEVERLKKMTGLSDEQLFLSSLRVFRDVADAYLRGAEVYIKEPGIPEVKIAKPY